MKILFAGAACWTASLSAAVDPAVEIIYPLVAGVMPGVVDVTAPPHNVDNTGQADVTAQLQAIIDAHYENADASLTLPRIIYFPNGTYLVSGRLTGPTLNGGAAKGLMILQGQNRDNVTIRLKDNCNGSSYVDPAGNTISATGDFSNPVNPLPVLSFFEGDWTNNAFMNHLENLTLDTGAGNPGAIGVSWTNNNVGAIRDVVIRSGDPNHLGVAGLDLEGPDGNPSGIGMVQNVRIEGFQYGVDATNSPQMPFLIENLELSDQSTAGIVISQRPLTLRKIDSRNSCPALLITGDGATQVVLLDSSFTGGGPADAAILRQGGFLYVRNCGHAGYGSLVDNSGTPLAGDFSNGEWSSHGVQRLWEDTPSRSLGLPIADTPRIPWGSPSDWAVVNETMVDGTGDHAPAIQAAMNSGKMNILFTPGRYVVKSTITIGPAGRRITGQYATLAPSVTFRPQDAPLFRFTGSQHPAVVIEKFRSSWIAGAVCYLMEHASDSDLVMADILWSAGPVYRNETGHSGKLFVDSVHSIPGNHVQVFGLSAWEFTGQDVFARAINPETLHPHMVNDGGRLVVLSFKTGEQSGPVLITRNGGQSEILGGLQNITFDDTPPDPDSRPLLESEESEISAILMERFEGVGTGGGSPNPSWGNHRIVVKETRAGETRLLLPAFIYTTAGAAATGSGVPQRPGQLGSVLHLFNGYPPNAIEAWRYAHFGTTENQGDAADNVNPDSDNLRNDLEFAFVTDPLAANGSTPYSIDKDGTTISLTWRERPDLGDRVLRIEAGNDLQGWQALDRSSASHLEYPDYLEFTLAPAGIFDEASQWYARWSLDTASALEP